MKKMLKIITSHKIISIIFMLVIVSGVAFYEINYNRSAKFTYITQTVQPTTLMNEVNGTGNLQYSQTANVNSQISGTISSINVSPGQNVTLGQTLFKVNNSSLAAQTSKLYASYLSDQHSIASDQATLIQDQNNISNIQYEIANDQLPTATMSQQQAVGNLEQQLQVANAQLAATKIALNADIATKNADLTAYNEQLSTNSESNVTAPISGTVVAVNVASGQLISATANTTASANNPEIVIVGPNSLVATVSLNEVDAAQVKDGQQVQLSFNALPNLNLSGTVTSISPLGTVSQGVVTYNVIITPIISSPNLKSGMSVSANITTAIKNNVLSVPASSIKTNGSSQYVQLLVNNQPVNKTVTTGLVTNNGTEITTGLAAGDKVITQIISNHTQNSLTKTSSNGLLKLNGGGGFRNGGAKSGKATKL